MGERLRICWCLAKRRRDMGLTWVLRRWWFHVVAGSAMLCSCWVGSGGRTEGKLGCFSSAERGGRCGSLGG